MPSRKSLTVLIGLLLISAVTSLSVAIEAQGQSRDRSNSRGSQPRSSQTPPGAWWHKYPKELGMSPTQIARVEEIFQSSMKDLKPLRSEHDKLEAQLSALISSANATEAQVAQQADAIEAVRSRLGKGRTLLLFRLRQVLTPEQRVKLEELHKHSQRQSNERRK